MSSISDEDRNRLTDMLRAAQRARAFVEEKNRADLDSEDQLLGYAVVHAIQVIGEAANQVTSETRDVSPEIPWHNIIGMRHRVVHDYVNTNYDVVWEVVTVNLPTLIPQLEAILNTSDD